MMQNLHFHHSKLVAALAASAIAATLGATGAGAVESAQRRLVVAQAADKASGEGVIKGVNASERKLKITHEPIAALNWPGMTMAFSVSPNVDLTGLAPGVKVKFTLIRDAKGLHVIDEIHRAE